MEYHEVCNLFPTMPDEDFNALVADIAKYGLREPIWTYNDLVIDGRHRYKACCLLGKAPAFREWDGNGSLTEFVVSLNIHRRHLTASQKGALAVEIKIRLAVEAKERQRAAGGDRKSPKAKAEKSVQELIPEPIHESLPASSNGHQARDEAAQMVGINPHYVTDAEAIQKADPDAFEEVRAGTLSIPAARKRIRKQAEPQLVAPPEPAVEPEPAPELPSAPEPEPVISLPPSEPETPARRAKRSRPGTAVYISPTDPTGLTTWITAEYREGNMDAGDVRGFADAVVKCVAGLLGSRFVYTESFP